MSRRLYAPDRTSRTERSAERDSGEMARRDFIALGKFREAGHDFVAFGKITM